MKVLDGDIYIGVERVYICEYVYADACWLVVESKEAYLFFFD